MPSSAGKETSETLYKNDFSIDLQQTDKAEYQTAKEVEVQIKNNSVYGIGIS